MAASDDAALLAFVNSAPDGAALVATVEDDPSRGAARGRTLPPKLAFWLVRARDELYGGAYQSVQQIMRVHGVGDGDVLADLRYTAARTQTCREGSAAGQWTAGTPDAVRSAVAITADQEARVLAVLNAVSASELAAMVPDDPAYGAGPPRAYGVRGALATWLVRVRDGVFGGAFGSLADVASVSGVGSDTLHDIVVGVLTPSSVAEVAAAIQGASAVVVVTGAGASLSSLVRSGAPPSAADFRADVEAFWTTHLDRRNTATTAWASNVSADAVATRALHNQVAQLADWCQDRGKGFAVLTQNQDRFHLRAEDADFDPTNQPGASYVVEMHGNLYRGRCPSCGSEQALPEELPDANPDAPDVPVYFTCSSDDCDAMLLPSTVWVGEAYAAGTLGLAGRRVLGADVVIFLGTSGRAEVIRWLLYEARFHARAATVVVDEDEAAWAPYAAAVQFSFVLGASAFMAALIAELPS